jgi:CcmD family protein
MKKFLLTLFTVGLSLFVFAQDSVAVSGDRQATGLRAEGKIYVVMAVVTTILVGLFVYLIRLDRKISKLEKKS